MNGTIDYSVLDNEQFAKLESGSRGNVQFKPSKKMKKRRQLDALVSNGKKLPRRKNSGHELLRSNDSESSGSEVEEFSVLENQKWGKRWSSPSCCSTCYTLTCIVIMASCLLACAALIWMHLQLKHDFNQLKERVQLVENKNAGTPEEFQSLLSKVVSVNKTVTGIRTGKYGLEDLNRTIVSMQKQITSLTATATELQKTVQSRESNDKQTLAVASTVADLGATLQSTKTTVDSLKDSQKSFSSQLEGLANRVSSLENPGGREGGFSTTDTENIQALLSQINATFTRSIGLAMASIDRQQTHLDAVDKFSQDVEDQVKNISQVVSNLTRSQQRLYDLASSQPVGGRLETEKEESEESTDVSASLIQLQEQVQHLQLLLDQVQADHKNVTKMGEATDSNKATVTDEDLQSLMKDHEDFLVFRTEVFNDITSLNATLNMVNGSVDILNKDVGELFVKLGIAMSDISNVSNIVERLTKLLPVLLANNATRTTQEGVAGNSERPSNHSAEEPPSSDTASGQSHENEPRSDNESSSSQPSEGDFTAPTSTTPPSEVEENEEPASESGPDTEYSESSNSML